MSEPFLGPWQVPEISRLVGRYVTVERLDPQRDCADLYQVSHTPQEAQDLFRFMSFGPFESQPAMRVWLDGIVSGRDPLFFSVRDLSAGQRVGMISLLNIFPAHGRAELGNIWYSPLVQRTKVNSEVTFLFLKTLFREYRYRRVEWKCDNDNLASKRAALRLGFHYEGLFQQHMIVKGTNRDTAWFAMFAEDWPQLEQRFEAYLSGAVDSLARLNLAEGEG